MRKVRYGTLKSYRDGVASGSFDQDLDTDDRAATIRLLDFALQRVQYSDLPPADLYGMVRDPMSTPHHVNVLVGEILDGCAL